MAEADVGNLPMVVDEPVEPPTVSLIRRVSIMLKGLTKFPQFFVD